MSTNQYINTHTRQTAKTQKRKTHRYQQWVLLVILTTIEQLLQYAVCDNR